MGTTKSFEIVTFPRPTERLEYTGERFTSGQGGPIEHEHRHRYLTAASICREKIVLDIASGEGFGSAFLATVAKHCTGVDVDPEAIGFARANYARDNLQYLEGTATKIPVADGSIDVVVSFETIEHFHQHEAFMAEIRRVLRPDGVLLISSPNRGIYDGSGNHFHVRELTQAEFIGTVRSTFSNLQLLEQKATTGSVIAPVNNQDAGPFLTYLRTDDYSYEARAAVSKPPYSLILASNAALPELSWGVLDDEGYVPFLQRWITNSDNHHTTIIESLRNELETSERERIAVQKSYADLERSTTRERRDLLKNVARAGLEQAKLHAEGFVPNNLATANQEARLNHREELEAAHKALADIRSSTSWKILAPARAAKHFAQHSVDVVRRALRPRMPERSTVLQQDIAYATRPSIADIYSAPLAGSTAPLKRVLLVAELSLKQCAKYRVWQKKEAIEQLGYQCTVVSWGDGSKVKRLLQTHSAVIFYRVPGWPESLLNMQEAHRLGIPIFWEVDDLIFDSEAYKQNRNLDLLTPDEKASILLGAPLYRDALRACKRGIASTRTIADFMRKAGVEDVTVVQNCLDNETLAVADRILASRQKKPRADSIILFYGSGSRSHDFDFLQAAPAIEKLFELKSNVRLRIAGTLELPPSFEKYADRVERLPMTDFQRYLGHLSAADISIAPLEPSLFNDAKSNIKFLESAVVEVPCICSPRSTFTDIVRHGINGLLADTEEEWLQCLVELCDDKSLRENMGRAANRAAREQYAPTQVSHELQSLLPKTEEPASNLKVLIANVYFSPQSFGGATVVCEQMAHRMNQRDSTSVSVFTSLGVQRPDYELVRYNAENLSAFAVKFPAHLNSYLEFENYRMADIFREVLEAVRPDVVHLHSIQGLSASIADACLLLDIPYVITFHDAWWICERQFMVNVHGQYCGQSQIDQAVCSQCVSNGALTSIRTQTLRRIRDNAALLLAPSEFSRQLHISNGVREEKIKVNRNGIAKPANYSRLPSDKLRFGFVGGIGGIKGADLILKAFTEIENNNYELVIVDNTTNLGGAPANLPAWNIAGQLTVRPGYKQDELDAFFSGIDVLLFPSQVKESFGLTVREALIRDVWVIATDAGGAAEDIVQDVNGDILPFASDHHALRHAIQKLLDAPGRLTGYRNPHSMKIRTYDEQAEELHTMLREAVELHRNTVKFTAAS